jgi:FHA domain
MQGLSSGVTNSELRVRVESQRAPRTLRFAATQTVWLGRDHACEVALPCQEISRRHASLFVRDGQLCVRDHSTYGTRLNGQPLSRALRLVSSPALLMLGPYRIEVTLGEGALALDVRLLEAAPHGRAGMAARVSLAIAALLASLLLAALWLRFAREQALVELAPAVAQRPCPRATDGQPDTSVLRAVQLLRAGDRVAALQAYRTLAARDDSRAELSIVAELLARELSCQP